MTKRRKTHAAFDKNYGKQERIPVGCLPAARSPYAGVCFQGGCLVWGDVSGPRGGVSGPRGMCLVLGVCGPGGCVVRGVSGLGRGMSVLGGCGLWGVCSKGVLPLGGCLLQVGCVVSQHTLRQTPPSPWTESQTPVKTLPWPNFIAAGNNRLGPRLWGGCPVREILDPPLLGCLVFVM